jgi:hypothetical protein
MKLLFLSLLAVLLSGCSSVPPQQTVTWTEHIPGPVENVECYYLYLDGLSERMPCDEKRHSMSAAEFELRYETDPAFRARVGTSFTYSR